MALKKTLPTRRLKKKGERSSKELEAFQDIADDVIESDFVPYACLFDPSTIATKDGELLQTIKITGLGYEQGHSGNLRQAVRAAIKTHITDTRYAIWLHTLRRKQPSIPHARFADVLSGKIDEAWRASQPSAIGYTNELYLTIVHASGSVSLTEFEVLRQSLFRKRDLAKRSAEMNDHLAALSATTKALLATLKPFGARLLTTVERSGIFYSEQLEFLEKLINLEERPMPIVEQDLSQMLTGGEITFGFNAMEVRSAAGHRRFAALMTLKEYKESTLAGIDKFLEIPCELIISQCFDFTGAEQARAAYEKQASYLTMSGDKDLAKWIEIERLMGGKTVEASPGFGQQQTTLFLIAPSVNQLESNVRMVQRALNRLGMLLVREDMRFEECYWSQLPANFTFITRKRAVDTDHLAGFVNLQAAPMGNANGSPWGPPVSLFTTVQDAPYYFNFHREGSAHSIILGQPGSGHRDMAHFLIAQARKLPLTIWYLDTQGRGARFIEALGGTAATPGAADCKLNPFMLAATPTNREFLALWVSTLIDPSGTQLNRSSLSYFQMAVDYMLALPAEQRRMANLIAYVREADPALAKALMPYAAGGAYGELFDMPSDNFTPGVLSSWNVSRWMADAMTRIPLMGYLLHRLTASLSGKPTLLVLDEGFTMLDTPLFSARIAAWCDHLSASNAAFMLLTDQIEASAAKVYTPILAKKAATLFALPDKYPDTGYSMGFGFSPSDVASLGVIDARAGHVLQKRGAEATVIRAAIADLPAPIVQALSGKPAPSPADTLAALMGRTPEVAQ